MVKLKVGVCESPPEVLPGSSAWKDLCRVVSRESPDFFLLNEMPFGRWIASGATFDQGTWKQACALHEEGLERLGELGASAVAGSRPREADGRRVNEAFLWTEKEGARGVHTKQYFPDEEGFFEARWFQPGESAFQPADCEKLRCGFLICTDLMFNEHARHYGRSGVQVIFVPRATSRAFVPRWRVAMRMAAIVSGCFVLSSNRGGTDSRRQLFGGAGWIVTPDGEIVSQTSDSSPVAFSVIDTHAVARAKRDYPCYVKEVGSVGRGRITDG